jgi:predicted nucleic acid-binding protein
MLIAVDEEIAVNADKIRRTLKRGREDAIVYAAAKQEGSKVLTEDPDFMGVENVIFLGQWISA